MILDIEYSIGNSTLTAWSPPTRRGWRIVVVAVAVDVVGVVVVFVVAGICFLFFLVLALPGSRPSFLVLWYFLGGSPSRPGFCWFFDSSSRPGLSVCCVFVPPSLPGLY